MLVPSFINLGDGHQTASACWHLIKLRAVILALKHRVAATVGNPCFSQRGFFFDAQVDPWASVLKKPHGEARNLLVGVFAKADWLLAAKEVTAGGTNLTVGDLEALFQLQ